MAPKLQAALVVLRDGAGLVGAACVVHGVAEIYAPAGWIVAGGGLLAGVWLMAKGDKA